MPVYTSQQIITRACAIAKVTPAMAPIAGVYLNNVLEELCMTYDLEIKHSHGNGKSYWRRAQQRHRPIQSAYQLPARQVSGPDVLH